MVREGTTMADSRITKTIAECWSCKIVEEYTDSAAEYVGDLSEALFDPMWVIFSSVFVLWLVIKGLQLALGVRTPGKDSDFIGGVLLKSQDSEHYQRQSRCREPISAREGERK